MQQNGVFQEYPRDSWEEIKEQLIARFGETTDIDKLSLF